MTGLQFDDSVAELLKKFPQVYDTYESIFMNTDLIDLGDRVKHLDVVSNAKGDMFMFYARQKEKQRHLFGALHLYKRALSSFEQALDFDPNNIKLLNNAAKALQKIELIELCETNSVPSVTELIDLLEKKGKKTCLFREESPHIYTANSYYQRALRVNAKSAETHANYALFKEGLGEWDDAEKHYLSSLQIDPNNITALEDYATFLGHVRRLKEEFAHFNKRALNIRQLLNLEKKKTKMNVKLITRLQVRPNFDSFE